MDMETMAQTFATKEDLHKVELRLEQGINQTKYDLIKWMITLWIPHTVLFLSLFFGSKERLKVGE